MTVTEDDLAQALIRWVKEDPNPDGENRIYPEARYNHYGDRGVADLFITDDSFGHLYELKSESAVRNVTGANEIVRQFNKMREFFFPGSSYESPDYDMTFELCFTPSEYNFRHIAENADIYSAVAQEDISDVSSEWVRTAVTVRLPDADNITPVTMFGGKIDFRTYPERSDENKFLEYVKANQPAIFEEYEEVLRKIVEEAG